MRFAAKDHKWVWAKAEIQKDNTIVVSSTYVTKPVAMRYGRAANHNRQKVAEVGFRNGQEVVLSS